MMEANELRIENWVNEINIGIIQVELSDIENIQRGDTNYKPIPLTEEWLLKFGFKKKNGQNRYELKHIGVVILNDCVCVDTYDAYNEVYNSLCLIKNIHQLQNLYFALTNTEL